MAKERTWTDYQIPGTEYAVKYAVEPGYVVTEFLGKELKFQNIEKMVEFYLIYFEASKYHHEKN